MALGPLALGIGGALLGAGGGLLQGMSDRQSASHLRREIRRIGKRSRQAYETERERFLNLDTTQLGLGYLTGAFEDPLGGSFGEEFANRLRIAQAARGFEGGGPGDAASVQEASFLARLADQRRRELLPMLNLFEMQAQEAGSGAFQRRFATAGLIAGAPVASTSPFGAALTGAVQGGLGGLMLGMQSGADLFASNFEDQLSRFGAPNISTPAFDRLTPPSPFSY